MFSCLMELPIELVQRIVNVAERSDVKNLSCCRREMYELSKKVLWKRIKVEWQWLVEISWTSDVTVRQLENLQYARSISFVDNSRDLWFLAESNSETFANLLPTTQRD